MTRRKNKPISLTEAERAIYLDFEGEGASKKTVQAPPPVLGGECCEGRYRWTLLDTDFAARADRDGAPHADLSGYLEGLVVRARAESRRIVFWTSHEENLFVAAGFPPWEFGFDVFIYAKRQFRALRKASRDARSKLYGAPKSKRVTARRESFGLLSQCAESIGLPEPPVYGRGLIGKWIKQARMSGGGRPDYEDWSNGAKSAWTKLLKHNEHDCRATEYVLLDGLANGWVQPASSAS